MGESDPIVRFYMEDYVNTYLKRLYPSGKQTIRVGLLLGNVEYHEGIPYIFVDGAMEMEEVETDGEKVLLSENIWKKAYQRIEDTFPKRTIQGWFLCGNSDSQLSPLNYWKQHSQYFAGKNQLMYLNHGLEGEESIYIASEDGFYQLKGHCIYYERNQMMQDYMITRKDVRRVESSSQETVIRDFRSRLAEKKEQVSARNRTLNAMGMLCGVLAVAVLAGGVVLVNNYTKMQKMESAGDRVNLEFNMPSRGIIGLRTNVLTASAGEAIMAHRFKEYQPYKGDIERRTNGSMIAMESGTAFAYAIDKLQDRGKFFIFPQDEVYAGQVVGEHVHEKDLVINVTKSKKLTNMRASGSDEKARLIPPIQFSLEEALEYIKIDEYVEVTPKSMRMRKVILDELERKRANRE